MFDVGFNTDNTFGTTNVSIDISSTFGSISFKFNSVFPD
jgi:hypothetical protein